MRGGEAFDEEDQFAGETPITERWRNCERTQQAGGLIGFQADNGSQSAGDPNTKKPWWRRRRNICNRQITARKQGKNFVER